MLKKLIILLAIMTMLSACLPSTQSSQTNLSQFTLEDINGETVNLGDFEGENVYVKFWASWCSICLAGLEEVNALASESTDFEVLTIVAPGYNNEKDKDDFIKWYKGVDNVEVLPVLLNEGGSAMKEFKVIGYPTSAFINKKGDIVKIQPGHLSNEQIKEAMEKLN